jgi:hypothetical protein
MDKMLDEIERLRERECDLLSQASSWGKHIEQVENELEAVLYVAVDKWFDDGDPRLSESPAERARMAREIALKAIEKAEEESERLRQLHDKDYEGQFLDAAQENVQLRAEMERLRQIAVEVQTVIAENKSPMTACEAQVLSIVRRATEK